MDEGEAQRADAADRGDQHGLCDADPVSSFILDILLVVSMTASIIVFLSAIQVRKAVDFSVFPTLLLLLTLFRAVAEYRIQPQDSVAWARGNARRGHMIESFGQFVVGGNYVVGFVLFLALIAIQFLVVSHGAVRTAEVTARFTLDALPGKQMAIDADMNAGLIDEHGARSGGGDRARGGVLWCDGRRGEIQPEGLAGNDPDYGDQYYCGACHRRAAAGHRPDEAVKTYTS